ncbi:MAG TPA: hypothetical protein VMI54_13460 [Polyangiaceae bacterium]|nr:hypothetical protein [Polyangiaceae bacterium]
MVFALYALAGNAAHAEPERIALVYSAPAECPDASTFHDEVRARVSGDWEAAPDEVARRISVTVNRRGERYVAAIAFLNPQGDEVTRSVAGQKCDDVVNGMALVTALAIESRVEEALSQSEPEAAPEPLAEPVPKGASAPKSEPIPAAPARFRHPAGPEPRAPARAAPARTSGAHVRFGAASVTSTGVGPDAAFGPALFATLELAGPRFGLSGAALWSGLVHTGGVPARFRRLSARADGCPFAVGSRAVAFEPCAFMELGSLYGQGESNARLASTKGGSSLWAVPGLLARFVGHIDPVVLVLDFDGAVPLSRERFGVVTAGARQSSFREPAVVFGGELGAGFRL